MKRALKKRVKAVMENTPGDNAPVEKQNVNNTRVNLRVPTKAAMIGLAISMGATSLLVTRQSEAQAAETVGSQNAASTISAAPDTEVNFAPVNSLNTQAVSTVSVPENAATVEPTAISQVPGLGYTKVTTQQAVSVATATNQNTQFPVVAQPNIASVNANSPVNTQTTSTSTNSELNAQLKAQQEFAINSLQQKSERLRSSLAQLRSPENKSQAPTLFENSATFNSVGNAAPELSKSNQKSLAIVPTSTPSTTSPVVASPSASVYQVKSGDTLAAIANNYRTSVPELAKANNLNNPNQLQINQKLTVPTAKNGSTGNQTTVATVTSNNQTQAYNQSTAANSIASSSTKTANLTTQSPMQLASTPPATTNEAKVNPRLRSLQQEIARLQEKYRAQESGNTVNTVAPQIAQISNTVTAPKPVTQMKVADVAIPVPPPMVSNYSAQSTQAQFPTQHPNDAAVGPVDPFFVYHQTQPQNNAPGQTTARVVMPSMGADVPDFSAPRGTVVSPQLPPLAAVDRYLPKAVDETMPSMNTPSGSKVAYAWPAKGVLTSPFGMRWGKMHRGIDVANSIGTPVYASADGVIKVAGWTNGGYGNLVDIEHPDGSMTRYGHNSKVLVHPGQQVHQGEMIALMGSTGFSTGPHSHFEIHPPGKGAMNPIAFLPARL